MQFTTVIAAAILASTSLAAPSANYRRAINATNTTNTTAPTPSAPSGLSLTQQLFIADTAVDRFALLPNDASFVFDFNNPALKGKGGKAGDIIAANRKAFPPLVSTGAGMAVGFLDGCAFNTPHVHPRSVELQIVTQGRLTVAMAPENGVFVDNDPTKGRRVITNTIGEYQMTPFYQGSVHTQFNPDCTPAVFVAAFNNEDFGAGQIADELFAFNQDIVSAAFGDFINGKDVDKFKAKIPVSVAEGVEQCLITCGITRS
jgi:Cupin